MIDPQKVDFNQLPKKFADGALGAYSKGAIMFAVTSGNTLDSFATTPQVAKSIAIFFNQQIEKYAISIIEKHGMKTLDAIQLSSAIESNADQFVTSDKRLFTIAAKATGLSCLFI